MLVLYYCNYLVEVCIGQNGKMLLDGKILYYLQTIVCSVCKHLRVPYSPKRSSCLRLHIEGTSRMPSNTNK